ncbi:zinc metalloprotease [Nocardioides flavus (ex Wang et al. 2016)]|uniref:Zinc metalloprotease n=1 Tax=Nocardioides flavus (ex Wang et al. 2016) TaxID=2058780 RepID=A0ABQ3HLC9_9ACTN|nr:zinc metalloprotease [Nocardioides flavus (ex Wang et al. 2016)]GHE17469.1 zinc metalloprotease [Nocardioides flavus (ex Wang et al. 2016)]
MNLTTTRAVRRVGVAATALALGMGVSTPTFGAPAKDKAVDCIEYGDVAEAPAGAIPRDDLHVVRKDPLAQAARAARTSTKGKQGASVAAIETVEVPVRFNVVYKDRSSDGGYLSDERIEEQIRVLNEGFSGTGFSFVLQEIDRVQQPEWFNLVSSNGGLPRFYRGSGKEVKMKQYFYGDSTSETLNIYSASLAQSLLGWAYFPSDFTEESTLDDPLPQYRDGVVVDYRSLPAVEGDTGDISRYSVYGEGDTATHEVGHWLELYHTFQGGCSGSGDYVDDTAPEASPAFGCPEGRDTCEGGGVDPITNFMDYTYDSCMTEFTAGQAARMQMAWTKYRAIS